MIHKLGFLLFAVMAMVTVTFSKPQSRDRQSYPYEGPRIDDRNFPSRRSHERNTHSNLVEGGNFHVASRVGADDSRPLKNVTSKILFGAKPSRGKRETSDIIFPGPIGKVMALGEIMNSPCGPEETFCEAVPNYPLEVIESIIKRYANEFLEFNGVDDVTVEQRISSNTEFIELCDANRTDVVPKTAETPQGWRYVVNTPNFTQIFQVEKCERQNSQCKFNENFPNNYRTTCVQKFIYRKILVAVAVDKKPEVQKVKFPSCCACVLEAVPPLGSRFGAPKMTPA